ncbi:GNAT family N-acetyltransferase [Herbidospora mongoliensis]|uniref:GNAT family N-acetyltransferase n=1 Tax=Herbidospora mongoliensis TaxID=688067 RepID=UPI00082AB58F|nr:GNAT family N-acetyltransferase [Herbidospora mongoliensis]
MIKKIVLGVPMALVDVDEALGGAWKSLVHEVDVVRVQKPSPDDWLALAACGFLPKPQVLTWRAAALASEEEFLARLARRDRQNVSAARRRGEAAGLRFDVRPVTPQLLDVFIPMYERQVAAMRYGWPVATRHRDHILSSGDRYFAVCAWDGEELAAACITLWSPDADEVRARFATAAPAHRGSEVSRLLYMRLIEEARCRGQSWVSLGSDPNLYGHLGQPGLFSFKSRLGFDALPSHEVDKSAPSEQADKIVALRALTDPSFILAYPVDADGRPQRGPDLRLEMYSSREDLDVRPYATARVTGVRVNAVV